MRNFVTACLVAGGLVVGTTISTVAGPEDPKHPNERASCVGLIAADHARRIPDGTHISEIIHGVKVYTDASGTRPGALPSSVAQQHLGSHAVCGNE